MNYLFGKPKRNFQCFKLEYFLKISSEDKNIVFCFIFWNVEVFFVLLMIVLN